MKTHRLILVINAGALVGAAPLRGAAQPTPKAQQFASSTVVLTSGDTLRGPLTLHFDRDLLLLDLPDGRVRTIPAGEVRAFAVRGDGQPAEAATPGMQTRPLRNGRGGQPWFGYNRARLFLVHRWNREQPKATLACPAFFELMSGGPITLYRRCSLVLRRAPWAGATFQNAAGFSGRQPLTDHYYAPAEKYFLGTPDGQIMRLHHPKRDVLAYFAREASAIAAYARRHHLRFTDARQLALLVDYANSLRPNWPASPPVARRQTAAPAPATQTQP
ncbi:hypothetical protein [Hymenobacter latericus]|uniref:hypothetical protein n=1 Tax=Hymenobacter sp. YIM 151858-1 TaxID=2987688 RepID=UPI002227B52F|nr:hypothetical protein [Hymenobacter sp. YIM 151858-1]UYZ57549.1 hypothetical protein OIS50_10755 [Hymenobacter sp. YIM 151858-1]